MYCPTKYIIVSEQFEAFFEILGAHFIVVVIITNINTEDVDEQILKAECFTKSSLISDWRLCQAGQHIGLLTKKMYQT